MIKKNVNVLNGSFFAPRLIDGIKDRKLGGHFISSGRYSFSIHPFSDDLFEYYLYIAQLLILVSLHFQSSYT